jgi:Ca2+-binding RTX toxin-like protein
MVTSIINKSLIKSLTHYLDVLTKLRQKAYSYPLLAMILSSCGSNTSSTTASTTTDDTSTVPVTSNSVVVVAEMENLGLAGVNDTITATSSTLISGTSVADTDPYDNDTLTVTADDDIIGTPTVSGIEKIIFTTSVTKLGDDYEFDVNLVNITGSDTVSFENTNSDSLIKTLDLINVGVPISVGSHFSTIKVAGQTDIDINLNISANTTLSTTGSSKDLIVNASGKSVTLSSSTATQDIIINNSYNTDITATSALRNVAITSNGDVTLRDLSALKGNIDVTNVGTINVISATNSTGTLNLTNERAPLGTDITITDANSAGKVTIKSAGSITATSNNGLASAQILNLTAAEESTIYSDSVSNQDVTVNAVNSLGNSTNFNLYASTLEKLTLGGSSPLVVTIDSADISTETIVNTNSDATLWLTGATADFTNVATSVKLRLKNFDGNTITIKDSQDFYLDTEIAQTSSTSAPTFDHKTDATSSTTNALTLKTFDSNTSNGDKSANIAGLNFVDVQTLTLSLLDDLNLDSSADLTGADLTSVVVSGTGDFDLNTNTITGSSSTRVALNASSLSGSATLNLDGTTNGVANIQTGSAADSIKIDGVTTDTGGFVVASNGSDDTIRITTNGDGSSAKININAGDGGSDTLSLAAGVDLSASNLTLTSVERILLTGGGTTQKIAASDVSGATLQLAEDGTGTAVFTVVADQTTINLSNFTFASSFASGTDSVVVNASSSSSGVTVTGTSGDDTITGSNANDTLSGGAAADTISGGTGNDTINGGSGADTLTGGAGDDEFDFASGTSTEASMDKITDYQAAAADADNDTIDLVTGAKGANSASIDVKSAIAGGGGSETVTATVTNGVVTLSGSDAGLINTLSEWIDAVSVDGVIKKAADDADAVGVVAFQLSGNTYLVESNDTFDNNTANVSIVSVIELTGLTGVTAVADAAAANTVLIA